MSQMQANTLKSFTLASASLALLLFMGVGATGLSAQESAAGNDQSHSAPGTWSRASAQSVGQGGTGGRWDHDIPVTKAGEALSGKPVNITINVAGRRNMMTPWALSATSLTYDDKLINPDTVKLLTLADVKTLRFPATAANVFHFATHKASKPAFGDVVYLHPNNNVGYLSMLLQNYMQGTAIIQVNYGSNQKGDGPGEPFEAAAFVAYLNGQPGDSRVIGVDSTGFNWKTVGFWAGLRAAPPLEEDDGYNILRVGLAQPIGVVYWEVGDQNYNNGYYPEYDMQHPGGLTVDFHAPYGSDPKEAAKTRAKNPALSPAAFAKNFVAFEKAMKAVDPKIHVGASIMTPGVDKLALEYNREIAKDLGADIDFVSIRWMSGPVLPPDWKNLDEVKLLNDAQGSVNDIVRAINEEFNSGKVKRSAPWPVQLFVGEFGINPWVKVGNPAVPALYTADAYVTLMERGAFSISWDQLHSPFLLNDNEKPGSAYQGIRMVRTLLGPKNPLLDAQTSNGLLAVHAALQEGGHRIAVMLINKDPKNNGTAKISLAGVNLKPTGERFDYDGKSSDPLAQIKKSELKGVAPTFTVAVPSYSMTVLWLDVN